jgi:hypothetical protein
MPKYQMNNKHFEDIKSKLARSLKETLYNECDPPPDELHVPYNLLTPDEDEPDTARASVTYIVNCAGVKKHSVDIQFKYDKTGRFLRETMRYV